MDLNIKFKIGDVVFRAGTTTEKKRHPCPDCKGEKKWRTVSPAGKEYEFNCPRCQAGYMSERDLSLDYTIHEPKVDKLTIGSVRLDTYSDRPVSYMCQETGLGSGSVHDQDDLFSTQDAATNHASILAKTRTQTTPWIAKLYSRTLEMCNYQISDATMKIFEDADRTRRVKLSMLIDDLNDCESIEEVRSSIEKFEWQ